MPMPGQPGAAAAHAARRVDGQRLHHFRRRLRADQPPRRRWRRRGHGASLSDRREFKAKVVGSDEQSDVALLKIDATDLPALRIGDSKHAQAGPVGGGDRFAVRPRPFGHRRHRQRGRPQQSVRRPAATCPSSRPTCAINQRQFRRPAAQHPRRGGRHQLADLQQLRRLHGRELRDPDRRRDERGASSSRRPARSAAACSACRSQAIDARRGQGPRPAATRAARWSTTSAPAARRRRPACSVGDVIRSRQRHRDRAVQRPAADRRRDGAGHARSRSASCATASRAGRRSPSASSTEALPGASQPPDARADRRRRPAPSANALGLVGEDLDADDRAASWA